jgi:hypothetical protein
MLNIRLVNPSEDPAAVANFYACQSHTYAEFAAEKAAKSITKEEVDDGCVYFIVAENEHTGEFAGGLRLYLRLKGTRLPVERVLAGNHKLHKELERRSRHGIAEISGLWAQSCWRGTGLSSAMVRVAVAAMPLLNARYGIAFSHHYVLASWVPIGFVVDPAAGSLPYPDIRYESSVIWIDPVTLRDAQPEQRALIFNLREALRRSDYIRWSHIQGERSSERMSVEARTPTP